MQCLFLTGREGEEERLLIGRIYAKKIAGVWCVAVCDVCSESLHMKHVAQNTAAYRGLMRRDRFRHREPFKNLLAR